MQLKFLKRLILSGNNITELWPLPKTIEYLNISGNNIISLDVTIPSLDRLITLDITGNNIFSIEPLA